MSDYDHDYTLSRDLVTAAHARLSAYAPFQQLVADGVIGSESDGTPWLFQGLDNEGRPFRDPEGSEQCVVVLSEGGEWAPANRHNTAYFPVLQMLIYADSTRHPDTAAPIRLDARQKAKHVFRILNRCFHLPSNTDADQNWPGLRVHSCVAGGPFSLNDVPGTQSATVRGECRYNTVTD